MFKKTIMSLGVLALCAACQPASGGNAAAPAAAPSDSAASSRVHASDVAPAATASGEAKAPEGATEDEEALYHIGYNMGSNIRQFDLSASEKEAFRKGFIDSLAPGAAEPNMESIGPKIQKFAQRRNDAMAEKNHKIGQEYADKFVAEGGTKTSDGYYIKHLTEGTGAQPVLTDRVKVHYTGTLVDGTKFDSSYDRKGPDGNPEPATFPLLGVIRCWGLGLQQMKVGGKARLVCPSSLAYGERSRPKIPGGSTLVFDVELLEIVTPPPHKPAPSATGLTTVGGDGDANGAKPEPKPAAPTGPGGIPQNPPGQPQWRK